uniref:Gypsy retrotransposon integrase-like protein 1 n=1 Tax=Podarcis muralis TaxID=64176 RepID=A0A670JQT7_PODMU
MKALARSYVWWPGIDGEIEAWVKHCQACQESRPDPPRAPVQSWESARAPWSCLHVDFAGPFQGKTFFIVVDSYTKWLEVALVPSTSTSAAIRVLRRLFATHGLPDTLVSDNGTAFTSGEFQTFTAQNAIRHIRSAPFHPATNGQAERMVRTTKDTLRRMTQGDWEYRLATFLLAQHSTPSSTTGRSPAELLMGRRLAIRLDRLHPDRAQDEVVVGEGRNPRTFEAQDPAYAKNFGAGPAWVPATVTRVTGPVSYEVLTDGGQCWRRHCDQIRRRFPGENQEEEDRSKESQGNSGAVRPIEQQGQAGEAESVNTERTREAERTPEPELRLSEQVAPDQTAPSQPASLEREPEPEPQTREHPRPQRTRRAPAYLEDYECDLPGRTGT